jgi:phenylalanyl-tRNA synthetase beta chain
MKISWKWLSDWVDLDGLDPEEVAEQLTMVGLECEGVEHIGRGHDNIVVGLIESIEPHPKADRLVVCKVNTGAEELHQIVCGATNMKEGDRVPAALPGSQPPAFDFEIGVRKMRGIESQGMLCAGEELGIDDGVDGLLILQEDLELGKPIFEALGLVDTVIELGITPNRPDCLSHLGVAREVAAMYDRELKAREELGREPLWEGVDGERADAMCQLEIVDYDGCPRYAFAVMEGVEVGPSPTWLSSKLTSIGVRSINNIVDITNYILFDIGQPLHAFDLDKVNASQIVVRRARAGEQMTGINHKEYKLDEKDLVIADAERAVAIAGVMGGEATEVTESTRRILIECAYFEPTTVRKSAKRHDLHTDSSHRFERGIDPGATVLNLQRAVDAMSKVCGGEAKIAAGYGLAQEKEAAKATISLPVSLSSRVLGIEVGGEEITALLEKIGIETSLAGDAIECVVPTWRPDLERPIDLVEEVGRLVGFDKIEDRLPRGMMGGEHARGEAPKHEATILTRTRRAALTAARRSLLDQGLHEAVNYSFFGEEDLDALEIPAEHSWRVARRVANPLTVEHGLMRTSLIPGLVKNLKTNLSQRRRDVALFEVGRRYLGDEQEPATLGILLAGEKTSYWDDKRAWDFYDLKGLIEALASAHELEGAKWQVPAAVEPYLHPGVQAEWVVNGERLAIVGRVHPSIEQELDLTSTLVAEVDLERVLSLPERALTYSKVSSYPSVTRDFAFVQDASAPYAVLEEAVWHFARSNGEVGELLRSVEVFDVYDGEHVEEGKRSVAIQVVFQSDERTLTDEELLGISERLVKQLEDRAKVTLRG